MIKLAESEIKSISLWTVLAVAVIGGLFAGFLGGGAGLRANAVAGVRPWRTHEGSDRNRSFRSCHLIQLRDTVARD